VDNKKINYPADTSSKAQDFIERLLRKNPLERIRIDTLLKHPFLAVNPNSKSYVWLMYVHNIVKDN
jgi:serine/threonine protein kinase